jgi:tetratricopeptide (TPR) repeat protein
LAADLEHWLADEPVAAYRDPLPARLGRWGRRHKPVVAGAAALLLTAVAALAISAVLIRQQKELVKQQRDRAERNLGLAMRAVEDTITKVAKEPLLKEANFHDLRKKLLASAVPYYQEFAKQESDDPELEAQRGRSFDRLAYVRQQMGEKEEAAADYREETAIFARLEAAFPDQPAYRQELAGSHNNLGLMLADLGRSLEAESEYREARAHYLKLAQQFPDVPGYRQELANSHNNLGLLLAGLDRRDEAEVEHRSALALREKLVELFPDMSDYRQDLAGSHNNLGLLLAGLDRYNEAEKAYRASLALKVRLAEQFPDVPDYRRELALSHNNLGNLLAGRGRREAELEYRAALALYLKLTEQFPAVPTYRQELAGNHNNLGILLAGLGRRDEAEKEYRASLAFKEKLAEQFAAVPDYAVDLGGGYVNFGVLLLNRGQPEAALPWYDKAITRLQAVLAKDGRLATARLFLRNAHWNRASALTQLNRHVEAVREWDRAIELEGGSMRTGFRLLRAGCLAQTGEHARAVAEANALTEGEDVSGPTLYDAACVCALAAASVKDDAKLTKQYAGRAVALLRQAQKAGFFKQPANVVHMKKDSDLRALLMRPDYQALLKELETPAKP